MAKVVMRTHVVVPKELVESVDELVGSRARSRFFTEAVQEKLARAKLAQVARTVVGSLADVDIPGWETRESAAQWVHTSRSGSVAEWEHDPQGEDEGEWAQAPQGMSQGTDEDEQVPTLQEVTEAWWLETLKKEMEAEGQREANP